MISRTHRALIVCLTVLTGVAIQVHAAAKHRVASSYEDTLRVLLLYNYGAGETSVCRGFPRVSTQTYDFVRRALDTTKVKNIRSMYATSARVATIDTCFGGKGPHVLVHINAGWGATSGTNFKAVLEKALNSNIGVVEIGDDDMVVLCPQFPWTFYIDMWSPMQTGLWLDKTDDQLYMVMAPEADTLADSATYPNLTGIIRNARKLSKSDTIHFRPVGTGGRCEADADVIGFHAGSENMVNFLAYQQGYNAHQDTARPAEDVDSGLVGNAWDYCILTVLQDTLKLLDTFALRRAVSLSMQPQFLQNDSAMQQIVYDAIMYASTLHFINPPTPYQIPTRNRAIRSSPSVAQKALPGSAIYVTDIRGRVICRGTVAGDGRYELPGKVQGKGIYVVSPSASTTVRRSSIVIR